jgi:hypothetical protein
MINANNNTIPEESPKSTSLGSESLPVRKIKRELSTTITDQQYGTCWAHSSARVLARLILNIFDEGVSNYAARCNYYYTEECIENPFDCFDKNFYFTQAINNNISMLDRLNSKRTRANQHFTKWSECLGTPETFDEMGNLKENFNAALYSYIYIYLVNNFGCQGYSNIEALKYFIFKIVKDDDVTSRDVATTLNFVKPCFESTCLPKRTSPPTINEIDRFLRDPYKNKICNKISQAINFVKNKVKNNGLRLSLYSLNSKTREDANAERNFLKMLKTALDAGYYANIGTFLEGNELAASHAMVIVDYETDKTNPENILLVIKNSWGFFNEPINGITPVNGKYYIPFNLLLEEKYKTNISFIYPKYKIDVGETANTSSNSSGGRKTTKFKKINKYRKNKRTTKRRTKNKNGKHNTK